MATTNSFALLGDDENDDPSQLITSQQQKVAALPAKKPAPPPPATTAKLPSKLAPPAQAVRNASSTAFPRGGGGGGGGGRGEVGRGRGGRGSGPDQNRNYGDGNFSGLSGGYGATGDGGEDGETRKPLERERGSFGGPRQSYHGGRRGGFGNEEVGGDYDRSPRRVFERHSGTGRGNELKREGSGRGNWGTMNDDVLVQEATEVVHSEGKVSAIEKQFDQEDAPISKVHKEVKEGDTNEDEEKKPEDKEMTLDEYEKIKEEKRKALLAMKSEERKVDFDKDFLSMQQLSLKKENVDIFIKLDTDKDSKRKDNIDRDERVKKSVSINEFLKPAEGERYYTPGGRGRGRGRGRGDPGQPRGTYGGDNNSGGVPAPVIDDPGHFPTLQGKK